VEQEPISNQEQPASQEPFSENISTQSEPAPIGTGDDVPCCGDCSEEVIDSFTGERRRITKVGVTCSRAQNVN
jgi:hypothetical protein